MHSTSYFNGNYMALLDPYKLEYNRMSNKVIIIS